MSIYSNLWSKLRNKEYRDAFVASQFKRSIPFQITALRKKLGWSQEQLAEAAKVSQGVISRAENQNYGNLTFNTVLRVAAGLDVAVVLEFVPFSKLIETFEKRSEDLAPSTFGEEDKARETKKTKLVAQESIHIPTSILSDLVAQYKQKQAAEMQKRFSAIEMEGAATATTDIKVTGHAAPAALGTQHDLGPVSIFSAKKPRTRIVLRGTEAASLG